MAETQALANGMNARARTQSDQGYSIHDQVFDAAEMRAVIAALAATDVERTRAGARHILKVPASASCRQTLRVLPNTHRGGVFSDEQIAALAQRARPVDCVVSSGGVVAIGRWLTPARSRRQPSR